MKAAFRTPLSTTEIRSILARATPERIDCALLRYAAPAGAAGPISQRSDGSESSSE